MSEVDQYWTCCFLCRFYLCIYLRGLVTGLLYLYLYFYLLTYLHTYLLLSLRPCESLGLLYYRRSPLPSVSHLIVDLSFLLLPFVYPRIFS